uniref:Uncharacterized protein n=1 Tax=Oryza sativa subsp. japonica TaxID=39947 RepID=Q2QRC8_ORYSJ|nr:hypothetical protein LOC_Os12g28010 [Oryza sativa Japonica Group]
MCMTRVVIRPSSGQDSSSLLGDWSSVNVIYVACPLLRVNGGLLRKSQAQSSSIITDRYRYIRHVSTQEQLSTRVGCGRVHHIIENDLNKCRVVAPNLPTKTDNLSHSTGHGWTT